MPTADATGAWLFFHDPMPGASTITLHIDGAKIKGPDGAFLDADSDGMPGGVLTSTFTTVSTAAIPNTSLTGRVVDPGPDLKPMTFDDIRAGPDGALHTADDVFINPFGARKSVHPRPRERGGVLVDVSNPTAPRKLQTIEINASQVEIFDGIAYTNNGGELQARDLVTGGLFTASISVERRSSGSRARARCWW